MADYLSGDNAADFAGRGIYYSIKVMFMHCKGNDVSAVDIKQQFMR